MQFQRSPRAAMDLALKEARRGLGRTRTNPLVGAVLLHRGHLIGRGSHRSFGGAHAERDLLAGRDRVPPEAMMACTLEPCVHTGKTPPCVDRLLEVGVNNLILSRRDPHPEVNGEGIRRLREEGVRVTVGVRTGAYGWLNRAYFYRLATGIPYLEAKLALTVNGRIATTSGASQWITGEQSRRHAHRLRARSDGIMVGAETVRSDDPTLTDRVTGSSLQPRAVVVCRHPENLPPEATLFTERADETLIMLPNQARSPLPDWIRQSAVEPVPVPLKKGGIDWSEALPELVERGMNRILIEGGGRLIGSLLEAGMVPEWHLYYSGRMMGPGRESLHRQSPVEKVRQAPEGLLLQHRRFGDDVYVHRALLRPFEGTGLEDLPRRYDRFPEVVR